ncbi:hypothetical protein COU38_02925, partial [Candidatus Micrarchaeota archaeon CG10_big_fil_rev_8_21_14_0_10_54_18]
RTHALIVLVGVAALLMLYLLVQPPVDVVEEPPGVVVVIDDFFFNPEAVLIESGASVTWSNNGLYDHAVAFDFFASPILEPGKKWTHQFTEPGDYEYYSPVNELMHGTVRVTE